MDLQEKYGIVVDDEIIRASIRKACLKVRVNDVLFYVPLGQVESFVKMSLSGGNTIGIFSYENEHFIWD